MRHFTRGAAALLFVAGANVALAQTATSPALQAVDRAVDAWSRVRTAHATFVQTLTNPLTGGSATARGEFFQERPSRLAIRFTDPKGDMVVADGNGVWVYLPSSAPNQVMHRVGAHHQQAVPVDLAGQFLETPRTRYDITDGGTAAIDGIATRQVNLAPKSGVEAPFTSAKVWISDRDGMIRQFEIVEPSGITRRVRIATFDVNPRVDPSVFRFRVPRGARVVESR